MFFKRKAYILLFHSLSSALTQVYFTVYDKLKHSFTEGPGGKLQTKQFFSQGHGDNKRQPDSRGQNLS